MGKIIPIISVIVITVLAGLFFYDSGSVDKELLNRTFSVDAVYLDSEGVVEISFVDNTQKTDNIILEVLGLQPSFQKTYSGSSFTERIPFIPPDKYGWEIHPVIILAENQDLGLIEIKTEIHEENEPEKPVIFSKQ
ncbi:MAG: hypothetical protein NPMRTHETA2_230003 [Nitrosopumilales archaeon]|nr:MAG: hypothetical protein NPMRTHETA2_230003 [Nitrosopumilales archaeon]